MPLSKTGPYRGRVLIYVVGFEARYWSHTDLGHQEWEKVDVREYMPRDPAFFAHIKKAPSMQDYVVQQDGFAESVEAIVQCCLLYGRCIAGTRTKITTNRSGGWGQGSAGIVGLVTHGT